MTQEISKVDQVSDCLILTEEWEAILKAISCGKYSWACVLILHSVGYNPLTYIPYSTYLRLIKKNNLPNIIKLRKIHTTRIKFVAIKTKITELD